MGARLLAWSYRWAAARNSALCYNGNHLAADTDTAAADQPGLRAAGCSVQAVNEASRTRQSSWRRAFSLLKVPTGTHPIWSLRWRPNRILMVKAFNKERAPVGAFFRHCEISRRFINSCSVLCVLRVPRPSDVTWHGTAKLWPRSGQLIHYLLFPSKLITWSLQTGRGRVTKSPGYWLQLNLQQSYELGK